MNTMVHAALRRAILKYYPQAKLRGDSKLSPHSEIVHFRAAGTDFVAKLIEEKVMNSYSPKQRERALDFLSDIVQRYYSLLKKKGVPVPAFYRLVIDDNNLIEFATDLGTKRLDTLLKVASPSRARRLMDQYVKAIAPMIQQKQPTIGFDAAAENFLLNSKKELVFCDFVPARLKQKGEYIVGFPQSTSAPEIRKGYSRYFIAYGILRRARIFFLNTNYKLDEFFFQALQAKLTTAKYEKIHSQFTKSSEFKLRIMLKSGKLDEAIKLIKKTKDTDSLREMAAWVFWLLHHQPTPPEVYDLSRLHLHFSAKERRQRLSAFRKSIIDAISETNILFRSGEK